MSKNAMAGAVTLCGVGLCVIGAALMMQSGNSAHAAGGVPLAAVAAVAHAQAGPTVVWYGSDLTAAPNVYNGQTTSIFYRAWSDGRVEYLMRQWYNNICELVPLCDESTGWKVLVDPSQGYRAAADFNADEQVNGADLASILGNWGDAPRVPFPPSDCPLNLINP